MNRINEQRRRAARLGAAVRSRRAAVKQRVAAGELDLEVLLVPTSSTSTAPWPVHDAATAEEIPIGQLVRSVRGIGPKIAGEILTDLQLDPARPLAELPPDQRRKLAAEIERT